MPHVRTFPTTAPRPGKWIFQRGPPRNGRRTTNRKLKNSVAWLRPSRSRISARSCSRWLSSIDGSRTAWITEPHADARVGTVAPDWQSELADIILQLWMEDVTTWVTVDQVRPEMAQRGY